MHKQIYFGSKDEVWDMVNLEDLADIIMGQSPESQDYNQTFLGKGLIQGNADIKKRLTLPRVYSKTGNKQVYPKQIIMSVRAPVGSVAWSDGNYYIGRGVCAIDSKNNEYIYYQLLNFETKWQKYSTGSTFDSIDSKTLKLHKIKKYKESNIEYSISSVLSQIDKLIENSEKRKGVYADLFWF